MVVFGGRIEAAEDRLEGVIVKSSAQNLVVVLQDAQHACFAALWSDEGHLDFHGVDDAGVDLPRLHQTPELLVLDLKKALTPVLISALPAALAVGLVPIGRGDVERENLNLPAFDFRL